MASPAIATIPTPPRMSFGIDDLEEQEQNRTEQNKKLWIGDWLKRLRREGQKSPSNDTQKPDTPPQTPTTPQRPGIGRRLSKKVGVGLPRSTTFKRQQDEHRQNLEPVAPSALERRQLSVARLRALSASPKKKTQQVKREISAPDLSYHVDRFPSIDGRIVTRDWAGPYGGEESPFPPPPPPPPQRDPSQAADDDAYSERSYETSRTLEDEIRLELERTWILNLSMHFRDKSPREKFFVTYAQTPQKWRRVTVSCDYRHIERDSLEADLQATDSQREKSARIYESLRGSLGDIQFYNTVTNLKLETRDDRLHVHVTEDVNEIIQYPPVKTIQHLTHIKKFRERELVFMEHMSGFVYKVNVKGNVWIKKEIPGPDSVDEFLYEVNALSHLTNASHVIELKGLVLSDDEHYVKGLLIAYAEKNALVDIIYDNQGKLEWAQRERWARQIVQGLEEIHEAGFVQGDFTLSNIVIDGEDQAQIIDINRRGCPMGWEPPEIESLIASGQRISMFIGIKSDLFQLGMVLWALAMENDEPDRQPRPLTLDNAPEEIPGYFRGLVQHCLYKDPVMRPSAKELLREFPASVITSDEVLSEIRPAPNLPSVPVVNGGSRNFSVETPEVLDPPFEHLHKNLLQSDPLYNELNSSVDAQESSSRLRENVAQNGHPELPSHQRPASPSVPHKAASSKSSSSLPNQTRQYHDAPETITLDPETNPMTSQAWTTTLDRYEIDPSILSPVEEPANSPLALPAPPASPPAPPPAGNTHPRRSQNSSFHSRTGGPSPPPHVDSGLADVETPRTSLERHHPFRRSLPAPQQSNTSQLVEFPAVDPSDEPIPPPSHIDSGFGGDGTVSHVGLHEGLSFMERIRGTPGMGEELDSMLQTKNTELGSKEEPISQSTEAP